jgi:GTP pyrophosphokinase
MRSKVQSMNIDNLILSLPDSYASSDQELVKRAYRVAKKAHEGQKRASGEPYINHCLAVAEILAELRVPPSVVAAGLLHDTVEDTDVTLDDIDRDFGKEICRLVDGVTKLSHLPRVSRGDQHPEELEGDEQQRQIAIRRGSLDPDSEMEQISRQRRYDLVSETLRKTFLAMGEDVRVILIKLADRLHNMRTLSHMPERKRQRIAKETLDIFAPLANRLGIWQIKWELEDLAFRYVDPEVYRQISAQLAERRSSRERQVEDIKNKLGEVLSKAGIQAEITARPKHIYSINRKMTRKGVPFEQVYDVRGVRIIVQDEPSCYACLGYIHGNWRPIPGEFDDYIAAPKDNFYRSLHTAVLYDDGKTVEIQIRTPEMNQGAEYGIAAHWRYKEGSQRDEDYERRIAWLRSLMEWRKDVEDAEEFVDSMKTDVFEDRVYVFTPRGDIIDLPVDSTPIDFAYHVHTDIGHRCRGAKINGKLVSLDNKLQTGDKVEILTAKRGGPSRDWLNPHLGMVKTQRARSKIRQWFKRQAREQNAIQGKALLEKELRRLGMKDVNHERLAKDFTFRSVDELHVALGIGDLPISRIVKHLTVEEEESLEDFIKPSKVEQLLPGDTVTVLGLKGLLTSMARCCNPAPGDEIIGYITRGRGATIHRRDCPNVLRVDDRERLVNVTWGAPKTTFPIPVRIKAYDRNGLMKDVATLITDEGINMPTVTANTHRNLAVFELILEVRDILQLSRVLDRLENLPNVLEAQRVEPG